MQYKEIKDQFDCALASYKKAAQKEFAAANAANAAETPEIAPNTVLYWLNQIPDSEMREKALANCNHPSKFSSGIRQAIFNAFLWSKSKEGHSYWAEKARLYEDS